jgi:hypothetical protein
MPRNEHTHNWVLGVVDDEFAYYRCSICGERKMERKPDWVGERRRAWEEGKKRRET